MPGPVLARLTDFEAYLRQNAIPIDGVTGNAPLGPTTVEIQFNVSATTEQISWGNAAKETYDWRARRMIARNLIVSAIAGLTTAQQNAILRHMIAAFIREHKAEALDAIATASLPLPIDEIDPNG